MDVIIIFGSLIAGILLGIGLFVWLKSPQLKEVKEKLFTNEQILYELREENAGLKAANTNLDNEISQLKDENRYLQNEKTHLSSDKARLQEKLINLTDKLNNQKKEVEELQHKFSDQFENLANKILEDKSKKFTELNQQKLGELLVPLKEKIKDFQEKVEKTHSEGEKSHTQLMERIKHLSELNQEMSNEARNLTKALTGNTKSQGDWGEVVLERVLELSGLRKGEEYEIQKSFTHQNGNRYRPDVVVHLPDDKHLIIDSKVSLTAYERYTSTNNDSEAQKALREHIQSLRSHITGLAQKDYQQLYDFNSPDFVMLFVPIESAFSIAMNEDHGIYEEAFKKSIVIVTPTTLLATMSTIHTVWKQEYQNRNAQRIALEGGKLYDKFVLLLEALQEVGKHIDKTQNSYNLAMKRLESGRGSLISRVEKLKELGAQTDKSLPEDTV
ncbi:MAG TPA: DNA recombination protein RmuC [Balneolales bacterium]|nr:DNA recombination protein RmuC [Balneolales bacterium]